MRIGVCTLVVALGALLAAAAAGADGPADTTTVTLTTSSTTATTTTTATDPATTAPTTTVGTTAPSTTAPTTTTPAFAAAAATALPRSCAAGGALALVEPSSPAVVVGAAPARLGATAYPASGSVATFEALDAAGAPCRPGAVTISSLSLFGGAVTVSLSAGAVTGLAVDGAPVSLAPGQVAPVGDWGQLVAPAHVGRTLSAPLALRLLAARAGLPAGTVVLVGFTSTPVRAAPVARKAQAAPRQARRPTARQRRHRHRAAKHLPLKVTPPLGLRHYVFPVAGATGVGDSYGGPRSDVSGGWHHGDDIFAPLGTPVLAVADGTLNRVGWERIGGWRLWVRDANGNQFYYAHLAAYSRLALRSGRVRAGDVIGFVGRTGDAFTTAPHLHFEIHPRPLLHLHYDGAVDPTTYLLSWPRETPARVPPPVRPRAPRGLPRLEAAVVWRQLLRARGIAPARRVPVAAPRLLPDVRGRPLERVAATARARPAPAPRRGLLLPLLLALAAAALGGGAGAGYARGGRR